jgi:hypothetical protein
MQTVQMTLDRTRSGRSFKAEREADHSLTGDLLLSTMDCRLN